MPTLTPGILGLSTTEGSSARGAKTALHMSLPKSTAMGRSQSANKRSNSLGSKERTNANSLFDPGLSQNGLSQNGYGLMMMRMMMMMMIRDEAVKKSKSKKKLWSNPFWRIPKSPQKCQHGECGLEYFPRSTQNGQSVLSSGVSVSEVSLAILGVVVNVSNVRECDSKAIDHASMPRHDGSRGIRWFIPSGAQELKSSTRKHCAEIIWKQVAKDNSDRRS